MKCYLVGGWVRDYLRNVPSQDRDWVVVGATELEMKVQGFKSVGASFPVFLHPKTKEEYALARQERKTGTGYHGFTIFSAPTVTLEEDLSRRDLTINAMAFDPETQMIIDPFGGADDWKNKCLRHVSIAFAEDPLRLIRLSRFYAVFGDMYVAEETRNLCYQIAKSGELALLAPERVRQEVVKVYQTSQNPVRFWQMLQDLQGMHDVFPMLAYINFHTIRLPNAQHLSHPFVAGLLHLQKAASLQANTFQELIEKLRLSRAEMHQCVLNQALTSTNSSCEELVDLIIRTRALHHIGDLQTVYEWGIHKCAWSWDKIEQAVLFLKGLEINNLEHVSAQDRKKHIYNFYVISLKMLFNLPYDLEGNL